METTEAVIAIIGMLVRFGLPVLLVAVILFYKHRRLRMIHETIARLAERGLPVPPQLLDPPRRAHSGLRGGVVLIGLGVGLGGVMFEIKGSWPIGLVTGLMGLALLISWAIEMGGEGRAGPPPPLPATPPPPAP